MTKFVGRRGTLGIATETVRGTPVAPTYWLPFVKMSFADTIQSARESQGMGKIADSDSFYVTMSMGDGDVESQLYDTAIGYILTSILGASPVTTGSYTHTYTMSNTNQQKTLSLYWQDPDRSYMFAFAVVSSVKMSIQPNGIVDWIIGFKSKTAKNWATLSPDFTTLGQKFLHQHLQFRLAANIAGLSGASPISLKKFDLTIDRKSDFDLTIGTAEPEDILGHELSVDATILLNLEDDTYRNYMLSNTYKSAEIKLIRSATSSVALQLPRVDFSQWQPDFTLGNIATQTINMKANYDSANALDIISSAILINSKAGGSY